MHIPLCMIWASFACLLFDEPYEPGLICTVPSRSEISDFLNVLKKIDKVVIADDVRKYGSEDMKKIREEIDSSDEDIKVNE